MTFTDKGKYSKHWWLMLVKQNPGKVKYQIQEQAKVSFQELKEALDALVMQRLISMHEQGTSAKVYTYELTTLGVRYINEHPEEDDNDRETVPPIKSATVKEEPPTYHPVPTAPKFSGPPEKKTAYPKAIATESSTPSLPETSPAPTPITPNTKKASTMAGVLVTPLKTAAKKVLADILYEKFGDEITAKELIERL